MWRGWRARPAIALLNAAGITLGVAVYLAIRIVNHSATRTFEASMDLVVGRSHLEVTGGRQGVDERCWPQVAAVPGVAACTAVVEGHVTLPGHPGEYLRVIGVDLFTAGPFGVGEGAMETAWGSEPESALAVGGRVVLTDGMAGRLGKRPGDGLELRVGGRTLRVEVAAVVPESGVGVSRAAFMDIGWAQELLDMAGRVTSLQLRCADERAVEQVAAAVRSLLQAGASVQAPALRSRQVGLMLQGFQLNLTALSLVSLLVGVFLTGNTIAASVVRQRREIGVLRAVGASRWQVRGLFLGEAALSALVGGALAVPLARWLAGGLLGAVSETISAHYVQMSIERSWVSWTDVLQALVCGLGAALVGAWLPAREASAVDPVQVLQAGRGIEVRVPRRRWQPVAGLALMATAALLSWWSLTKGPAWFSFGGCLALVLGFVLTARLVTARVALAGQWLSGRCGAVLMRLGAEHLGRSLHRASPVVAAVMTAVAMVLGVSIMIHSFRATVGLWVNGSLRADVYVAPAANEVVKRSDTLPDGLVPLLEAHPDVASVETLVEEPVTLSDGNEYVLRAVSRRPEHPLTFMGRDAPVQNAAWFQPGHVAVSEILAARLKLRRGDSVRIDTPGGARSFTVAGVFLDYSDDRGCLYLTAGEYGRHWPVRRFDAVAVHLRDPARAETLEETVRTKFGSAGELSIWQNARLRERVFVIFDQTFAVTGVLRAVAMVVAVLGIAMALGTLVAERRRETAVLRSVGATGRQVALLHLTEAGLIGVAAALPGLVCGTLLAMILTWVVNRAFFGWTVHFSLPWPELLGTPLWVTAAAVLAGVVPALAATRGEPAEALRGG